MTKTAQSERLVPCNIDKYHNIMVELVAVTSSSPHGTVPTVLAGRALGKHSHVMDGVSDGEKQDVQGGGGGGGREVRWSRVYHGGGVEKGR